MEKLVFWLRNNDADLALCTGKYKLRDLIVRGLIGIIVIFITINLRSTEFGVYSLAIIASLNIDSKRIVRFNVISNICFIVSVVLPALIGIIPKDSVRFMNIW